VIVIVIVTVIVTVIVLLLITVLFIQINFFIYHYDDNIKIKKLDRFNIMIYAYVLICVRVFIGASLQGLVDFIKSQVIKT
jgi:hypothetical protein